MAADTKSEANAQTSIETSSSAKSTSWWPPFQFKSNANYKRLSVKENYIDLYAGPHRGFPIRQVVQQDEQLDIIKSKTNWFQVKTQTGELGWMAFDEFQATASAYNQSELSLAEHRDSYAAGRVYFGVGAGSIGGTANLGAKVGVHINNYLSTELSWDQASGDVVDRSLKSYNLILRPFQLWRFMPFVLAGKTKLKQQASNAGVSPTIIAANNGSNSTLQDANATTVGVGMSWALSERLQLQVGVKNHFIFNSGEQQSSLQEWNLGMNFRLRSPENYIASQLFASSINSDDFVIGFYTGSYSIEDFSAEPTLGFYLTFNLDEHYFISLSHAGTGVSDESYRQQGLTLLNSTGTGNEAPLDYTSVALGFNFLPGEILLNNNASWTLNVHGTMGVGSTQFQGRDLFTLEIGLGMSLNLSDNYGINLEFRDHLYELTLLNNEKTTNNLELRLGIFRVL